MVLCLRFAQTSYTYNTLQYAQKGDLTTYTYVATMPRSKLLDASERPTDDIRDLQGPMTIPEGVDDNEFSLADLYDPRSKYPAEEKMKAVMAYVVAGDSRKASKICGVPDATIRWWKASADWWPAALMKCQKEKNDEVDAAMTEAIHIGMASIIDTIQNGEWVLTNKGALVRKPANLRDQTISVATLQDKRDNIRGQQINIVGNRDKSQLFGELIKKFEELSQDIRSKTDPRVIN